MGSKMREDAALVREFLTDVDTGGDTDAIGIFLADDAVDHHPALTGDPGSGPLSPTWWHILATADVDIVIEDDVAAADKVAVRGTVSGSTAHRCWAWCRPADRSRLRSHASAGLRTAASRKSGRCPTAPGSSNSWMTSPMPACTAHYSTQTNDNSHASRHSALSRRTATQPCQRIRGDCRCRVVTEC